jgi:putative flippase GtrA
MVLSYQGSRRWVFRHRATAHADGGVSAYVAINLATMALPVACLWVSRTLLGLSDPVADNISANVVGLTAGTWVRFWLFRQLVFNEATADETAGTVRSRVVSLRRAVRSRPQVGPLVAELGDEVA